MRVKKYLIQLLLVVILVVATRDIYVSYENKFIIEFDSIDNGIEYEFFYTHENEENFIPERSVKYKSKGSISSFEKNKVYINIDKPIKNLRIDFGAYPGTMKIKNVNIIGDKSIKLDLNDLVEGFNKKVDSFEYTDDYLLINSNQNDPYSVIEDINLTPKKFKINYYLCILTLLLMYICIQLLTYLLCAFKNKTSFVKSTFAIIVLVIISLPVFFINLDDISEIENRALAKFPKLIEEESLNPKFTSEFEKWFSDRFGFRKNYTKINDIVTTFIQPKGIEVAQSFYGKEDWLFSSSNDKLKNYQGIDVYTDEELDEAVKILVERNNWFKSQGIEYYLFIPPVKHNIYGEYYPDYFNKVSDNTKLKQLEVALEGTGVKIISPHKKILEEKENSLLYFKGDTHWNALGAFYG